MRGKLTTNTISAKASLGCDAWLPEFGRQQASGGISDINQKLERRLFRSGKLG
jgi:hypothetical protein